jgi:phospholipid-translocating ATPase
MDILIAVLHNYQLNFLLQAYHDTDVGIWELGTTVATSCLFVMLFHVAIETRSWVS